MVSVASELVFPPPPLLFYTTFSIKKIQSYTHTHTHTHTHKHTHIYYISSSQNPVMAPVSNFLVYPQITSTVLLLLCPHLLLSPSLSLNHSAPESRLSLKHTGQVPASGHIHVSVWNTVLSDVHMAPPLLPKVFLLECQKALL
jgi:hypothetical protein